MKKYLFIVLCFCLIVSPSLFAGTVAYWRFETGPAGTPVLHPVGDGVFYPSVKDLSGNGNTLSPWSEGGGAGFEYRSDVGIPAWSQLGLTNLFSIKNTSSWPASFTDSATSNPTGVDIEAITPAQFTIEALFKPESSGSHRTIVGRDANNVNNGDANVAALYFKINPDDSVSIAFADVTGQWHEATSAPSAIQGFTYPTDPDGLTGRWYYMAAVSDGKTLTLYLANLTDDVPLQIVAQTDITSSGSLDTSLAKGTIDGGDWHAGGWSVGRGLWDSGHTDRAWGFIDEVRISDTALDPAHFLLADPVIAWNPGPHYAKEDVGQPTGTNTDLAVDLVWNTAMDPENQEQVNPAVAAHYLYIVTDPADANAFKIDPIEIPAETPPLPVASTNVTLQMDKTYYWRVDESIHGSSPVDPNTITGVLWMFNGLTSSPEFIEHPISVLTEAGQDVEFAVNVSSVSTVTYKWYASDDNANNTPEDDELIGDNSPVLSLLNVQISNEAYYYCKAVNAGGEDDAAYSDVAALAIRRQLAHWTLDEASHVDGAYLDTLENYPADVNGLPDFVQGQKAEGVAISPQKSWATPGNWNPSAYSGQLTVTFWMNWAGTNGTWQTFLSKRSGDWGNDTVLWQISTNDNGTNLWFQSPRATVEAAEALAGTEGQWQHIAMTFDGTTGTIYINGQQRASGDFDFGDAVDAAVCLGGNSFDIGAREWMNGSLDDVRIFNYPVSEMDIARLYTTDAPDKQSCVQSLKPDPRFDLNDDCQVTLADFAVFAENWLDCALMPKCIQ